MTPVARKSRNGRLIFHKRILFSTHFLPTKDWLLFRQKSNGEMLQTFKKRPQKSLPLSDLYGF